MNQSKVLHLVADDEAGPDWGELEWAAEYGQGQRCIDQSQTIL